MTRHHTSARDLLLESTLSELATRGVNRLNVRTICDAASLPASLVNYHFGTRERLIAEATVTAYERYCAANVTAVHEAGSDPETQIRAWIESQFRWTIAHPGIAAILNYSRVSPGIGDILNDEFADRMTTAGASSLLAVATAIRNFTRCSTDDRFEPDEFLTDDELATLITHVMWTTLGFSTWAAGGHAPSRGLNEHLERHQIIERVIDQLIDLVRTSNLSRKP